jgi:DNA-binding response OmpR family regulator
MARVLVVDDDPYIRQLCAINLKLDGHDVELAADGEIALEKAASDPPDAVLLDVMMPRLSGWEVAARLMENETTRRIPVVFLTARTDVRDQLRGFELGAIDYVTKPFDPASLGSILDKALQRAGRPEAEEVRAQRIARLRSMAAMSD